MKVQTDGTGAEITTKEKVSVRGQKSWQEGMLEIR